MGRCDHCRYWDMSKHNQSDHADDQLGACRRSPPVLDQGFMAMKYLVYTEVEFLTESESCYWQQPITTGSGWCGEFMDKRDKLG